MVPTRSRTCTAFEGLRLIASGPIEEVALKTKRVFDRGEKGPVLVFDDLTSEQIELDLRGSAKDVLERLTERPTSEVPEGQDASLPRGPGRPKLGVVAREVTLLPRHWDWLNRQPGGASIALRKLVEEARRTHEAADKVRRSQEVTYRFMSAVAGNLAGFEEACRALFAGDAERFAAETRAWPQGVRDHVSRLSRDCLAGKMPT